MMRAVPALYYIGEIAIMVIIISIHYRGTAIHYPMCAVFLITGPRTLTILISVISAYHYCNARLKIAILVNDRSKIAIMV